MALLTMEYATNEEGLAELQRGIDIRNQMGGALYYNIINDECYNLANKLRASGADTNEIERILGI